MAATSLRRLRPWLLLPALLALPAAGCGGGGGGGGGGSDGGGGPAAGAIAGTVSIEGGDFGALAEREPNDALAQAQGLPPLAPGGTVLLAGNGGAVSARYGVVDVADAFRAVAL